MASIKVANFQVNVVIHNIDGVFQNLFNLHLQKGFWIMLTLETEDGQKESLPFVDEDLKIRIYESYAEALDDVASVLKDRMN
jgi:flagellum-specific peptidoglycan hydrolase FlgJ